MKHLRSSLLALSLLAGSLFAADSAKLSPVVSVDLGPAMLGFAGTCASAKDKEAADVIKNLRSVRIRVYEGGDSSLSELQETVKAQASIKLNSDWTRIVQVNKASDGLVEVHVKMKSAEIVDGIVITVASPEHQGVLVEIEGELKADQIQRVVSKLPIDGLPKGALSEEKA